LRESQASGVFTSAELETASGLPVVGSIPAFKKASARRASPAGASFVPLRDEPDGAVAEAFRALRANLKFMIRSKDSGTTLAVAKKLGRRWLGFDLSADYVTYANERLAAAEEGAPLNGPADPVGSSPTTAAGRRLKDHPLLPTFKPEDFSQPEAEAEGGAAPPEQAAPSEQAAQPAPSPAPPAGRRQEPAAQDPPTTAASLRELQQQALIDAFLAAHQDHSVDWLLCDPALQEAFHAGCRAAGLIGRAGDWNRELLKLRKGGKLRAALAGKKLAKNDAPAGEADRLSFAAEIAWAELQRKFPSWSLDALFCSPGKAFLFDRTAAKHLATGDDRPPATAARLRWAALRLRKARHALAEEAARFDYVLGTRDFDRFQPWARLRPARLAGTPGVYLLRGRAKEPLYVGEALDLGQRLADHQSAKAPGRAVTHAAVITSAALPSEDYRLPLWCDLVRRYRPRLNLPPLAAAQD
ncbi:MAG: hypothetical protein AAF790_05860, partial [Planctomycetota bacterium]